MCKNYRILVGMVLLLGMLTTAGCNLNYKQLTQKTQPDEAKLIKVKIHFTSNDNITAYVKSLGVEKEGEVYVGGSSVNYIYNQKGKIIGSFNYARVEYIKIIE